MTTNSSEILSPQRAYVYLGPVGTAAPADVDSELDPALVNVGLTSPDSLSVSTEPEFEEVRSHQSDYETRRIQSTDSAAVAVDLQQWNGHNLKAAMGGGSIVETSVGSGQYKYTPPRIGDRVEKMCVIEVIDGLKKYRWVFPRTLQIEGGELEMQKGQNTNLPLRMAVLGGDTTDPWYLLSNDPAFAEA
jgi:hypothetical protein